MLQYGILAINNRHETCEFDSEYVHVVNNKNIINNVNMFWQ